jgi:hypothetical protein
MDVEKMVKFAEEFGRSYVLTVLSILWNPYPSYPDNNKPADGSADAVLDIYGGRIYSYALISCVLGLAFYQESMGTSFKISDIPITTGAITLVNLFVFAGGLHLIVKLFGSAQPYSKTASVCLRILPLAYLFAGISAFIFSFLVMAVGDLLLIWPPTGFVFVLIQLVFIAVYLPASMRRVHQTGLASQVVMILVATPLIGFINLYVIAFLKNPPFPAVF